MLAIPRCLLALLLLTSARLPAAEPSRVSESSPRALSDLLQRREAPASQVWRARPNRPELLVFISLSMPPASLRRLAQQTARAGGVLLLRGLKQGSLARTVDTLRALGLANAPIQIDPLAFRQYQVRLVPTFVLSQAPAASRLDASGCSSADSYLSVAGDVSLAFALEALQRQRPDWVARLAPQGR